MQLFTSSDLSPYVVLAGLTKHQSAAMHSKSHSGREPRCRKLKSRAVVVDQTVARLWLGKCRNLASQAATTLNKSTQAPALPMTCA